MSNETQINTEIAASNATIINQEIAKSNDTVINSYIDNVSVLQVGQIIDNKYKIIDKLDCSSGESDLYLCTYDRKKFVAKVYKRSSAIKKEVVETLQKIDSPYVATLYQTGNINEHSYEILQYYKNGSLQGKKFTEKELKEFIVPNINEGLNILHKNGIIHKDIKPSNIMINDDKKSVSIIDFGISSVQTDGQTVLVTQTGMTPRYSAPETFRSLFLEESDYYSFGITLYELYCGCTPYENMSAEQIAQYTAIQRIPIPDDMPESLGNLIAALTYHDITRRNDKSASNRRWTYEEVKNWCDGKKQIIPGNVTKSEYNMSPYTFMKTKYDDISELMKAMTLHPKDGKKQLFRGLLSGFFKSFDPELAGIFIDAEDELSENEDNEDAIFFKTVYRAAPSLTALYLNGVEYENLREYGNHIIQRLNDKDKIILKELDNIMKNELLTFYASIVHKRNEPLLKTINTCEGLYKMQKDNESKISIYYCLGYILTGSKKFSINGKFVSDVDSLVDYLIELYKTNISDFKSVCNQLINKNGKLKPHFEGWLISKGYYQNIKNYKTKL